MRINPTRDVPCVCRQFYLKHLPGLGGDHGIQTGPVQGADVHEAADTAKVRRSGLGIVIAGLGLPTWRMFQLKAKRGKCDDRPMIDMRRRRRGLLLRGWC